MKAIKIFQQVSLARMLLQKFTYFITIGVMIEILLRVVLIDVRQTVKISDFFWCYIQESP